MGKNAVHAAAATAVFEIIENIARIREKYPTAQDTAAAESREYMGGILREAGLDVSFERGNIFAVLPGTDNTLPAVALISGFNLAPSEGKYGCALGAAGAVAVAGMVAQSGEKLSHPIEVIILADEFLENFPKKTKAFLELNIDHGSYLALAEATVGIVGAIASPTKLKITVQTDTCERLDKTPLNERQDALVSASMLVLAVRNIASQQAENGVVATVERLSTSPGGAGLIPSLVEMWVDIRGVKHDTVIEVLQEIKDEASAISEDQNATISIAVLSSRRPARMDGDIARLMEESCRKHKISYEHTDSLAEYAAARLAGTVGGGLALIPCRRGEDNPAAEIVEKKDMENGIKVLSEVLERLAKQNH